MTPTPELSFEEALADLERIVRRLEDGSATLDESIALYERGVTLLKECQGRLRHAEQRIVLLTGVDEEGKPLTQPFDHAASTDLGQAEQKRRPTTKPKSKPSDGLY